MNSLQITDLTKIKEIATLFNHLEPTQHEYLLWDHPFLNSIEWKYDLETLKPLKDKNDTPIVYDLNNKDDLQEAMKQKDTFINRAKSYMDILMMLNKRYYTAFFKFTYMYLNDDDFNHYLIHIFTSVEYPHNDSNISVPKWKSLFKRATKFKLMDDKENDAYNKLPDTITVYRGVKPKGKLKALSWTTDINKAKWFADRFEANGTVYKAQIPKEHVFCYILSRGESETILDYQKLTNIEEIHN